MDPGPGLFINDMTSNTTLEDSSFFETHLIDEDLSKVSGSARIRSFQNSVQRTCHSRCTAPLHHQSISLDTEDYGFSTFILNTVILSPPDFNGRDDSLALDRGSRKDSQTNASYNMVGDWGVFTGLPTADSKASEMNNIASNSANIPLILGYLTGEGPVDMGKNNIVNNSIREGVEYSHQHALVYLYPGTTAIRDCVIKGNSFALVCVKDIEFVSNVIWGNKFDASVSGCERIDGTTLAVGVRECLFVTDSFHRKIGDEFLSLLVLGSLVLEK